MSSIHMKDKSPKYRNRPNYVRRTLDNVKNQYNRLEAKFKPKYAGIEVIVRG